MKRVNRSILAVLVVLCFFFGIGGVMPIYTSTTVSAAVQTIAKAGDSCTTLQNVNLRATASSKSKIVTSLKKGARVTVLQKKGTWYKVRTQNGKTGFIYGKYLKRVNKVQAKKGTPKKQVNLTISAAASLTDAMKDIQTAYAKEQKDVTLTLNFGSSGSLQQQIEQGAPVDIFMSAAAKQMDNLEAKDLIVKESRQNLLKNKMVLVASKNSKGIEKLDDLATDKVKIIAIGDPASVPAGKYAQEVLTYYGLWDKVQSKLVLAKDVRQVLAYVEAGNAEAGFVFLTDAGISKEVKTVLIADEKSHSAIVYPVAIIKDSKNSKEAADLIRFMSSDKGQAVFEKYGFTVVKP